ncbi:PREDICTED: epididymal secretory protein 4-like [Gekko japonicus]|uniref:Epididymal secretory protein 4-like n=1 Tax=Gekko japonicus TaxID=146911 RepID=A0ABM1KEY2_GEKJA|nr:PREDICTED: epididymal secretory protein 4-like [Gekko japonicus]
MKTTLLIILLASIYLLHARADVTDVPVYPDFDVHKLAGIWYPIAVVLKNREPVNTIPIDNVVEPSDAGDLVLKMRYIKDGACQVTDVNVVHTDQAGVFTVPATSETVRMVDVDYESYHIVHVVVKDSYSLYLLSRTREPSDDVKTKFKELAETLGFDVNKIIYENLAGKSEFGGMFVECTTSIISIKVLQ